MKKLLLSALLVCFGIVNGADESKEAPRPIESEEDLRTVYFRQVQKVANRLRKIAKTTYAGKAAVENRVEFGKSTRGEMYIEVSGGMGGDLHGSSLMTALGKVCLYRADVKDGGEAFLRRVLGEFGMKFSSVGMSRMALEIGYMYSGGPSDPFVVVNLDSREKDEVGYDKFCLEPVDFDFGARRQLSQEELENKIVGHLVVPRYGNGEVRYALKGHKEGSNFAELTIPERNRLMWGDLSKGYKEGRVSLEEEATDPRRDLAPLFDDLD